MPFQTALVLFVLSPSSFCINLVPLENTAGLEHRTWVIWAGSNMKASFLWFSFHSNRKYYASCQVGEANSDSRAVLSVNHHNGQHGKITKGAIEALMCW